MRAAYIQRGNQRVAQERSDLVLAVDQRGDALRRGLNRSRRVERRELRGPPLAVLERRRVEREDLLPLLLIEPASGFRTGHAARDHLLHEPGQHERRAFRRIAQLRRQIARHVCQHVDARNIHRPEGRALGTSDRRSRDRIDLLDGEVAGRKRPEDLRHPEEPDAVADEVRRVFRNDDALPEPEVGELGHRREHARIGVGRRDELEKPEVAWWIEEVRAEPMTTKCLGPSLRHGRDGNS